MPISTCFFAANAPNHFLKLAGDAPAPFVISGGFAVTPTVPAEGIGFRSFPSMGSIPTDSCALSLACGFYCHLGVYPPVSAYLLPSMAWGLIVLPLEPIRIVDFLECYAPPGCPLGAQTCSQQCLQQCLLQVSSEWSEQRWSCGWVVLPPERMRIVDFLECFSSPSCPF